MKDLKPLYLETFRRGALREKVQSAEVLLRRCMVCPHACGVNRLAGERGLCSTGRYAVVASYYPHFGEEEPLVGRRGSGTIFFSHCNLLCSFCQNYEISHEGEGREITGQGLAAVMLYLQEQGCHNINLVTPTHVAPQILTALEIAVSRGLSIPLVYNTGGYDSVQTLKLLEGVIDIYMPDFKFWGTEVAAATTNAPDYPEVARQAIREMHRQVGDLIINQRGIAQRGLLVRHLVLPHNLAGSKEVMKFLAEQISADTYVNVMDQYRPAGKAGNYGKLSRPLKSEEYEAALQAAHAVGLRRYLR